MGWSWKIKASKCLKIAHLWGWLVTPGALNEWACRATTFSFSDMKHLFTKACGSGMCSNLLSGQPKNGRPPMALSFCPGRLSRHEAKLGSSLAKPCPVRMQNAPSCHQVPDVWGLLFCKGRKWMMKLCLLRTCLFILERGEGRQRGRGGGEREREKHWSIHSCLSKVSDRGQTCDPGMCPNWESNPDLSVYWMRLQTTEPHWPGVSLDTFSILIKWACSLDPFPACHEWAIWDPPGCFLRETSVNQLCSCLVSLPYHLLGYLCFLCIQFRTVQWACRWRYCLFSTIP